MGAALINARVCCLDAALRRYENHTNSILDETRESEIFSFLGHFLDNKLSSNSIRGHVENRASSE